MPAALVGELNHYYDSDRCGIGWHGDSERKIVAGARLGPGADGMHLKYQWFQQSRLVGAEGRIVLNAGDIYIASEKAVGTDWKARKVFTLRHAAGKDSCRYSRSKRKEGPHSVAELYRKESKQARDRADMNDAFTVTFGDRAENHAGMQMIGRAAAEGVSMEKLRAIKARLDANSIPCELIDLCQLVPFAPVPDAGVLIISDGVSMLLSRA